MDVMRMVVCRGCCVWCGQNAANVVVYRLRDECDTMCLTWLCKTTAILSQIQRASTMAAVTIKASTPVLAAGACQSRRVQPRAAASAPLRATAFKGTTLKTAAIKATRKQGGFVCKAAFGDVRVCLTADPCLIWKPPAPTVP